MVGPVVHRLRDSDIIISLYLVTDEDSSCYDKLETLSGMFRKVDDKANPQIYTVANRHLLARGVRQVVFSKFCSSENDRTDEMEREAEWIASVDPKISLHVTRFFPRYRMTDRDATEVETVYRLKDTAKKYLKNVYTGNC